MLMIIDFDFDFDKVPWVELGSDHRSTEGLANRTGDAANGRR